MSYSPPPLDRQDAAINLYMYAGARREGPQEASPLDSYKDARWHKPFHQEIVSGWDGTSFQRCKYDHIKKIWISEDGKQILKIEMWDTKK